MVVYQLEESPFRIKRGNYTFIFSSNYNLKRFLSKEEYEISVVSTSLSNRFKYLIKAENLARISLYNKIEKRGFCIKYMGENFKWLET